MSDRDRVNRRLRHLRDSASNFPSYNVRSLLGTDSIFDVLKYGEFALMHSIDDRFVGGGVMSLAHDAGQQIQDREIQVPLAGVGTASGRLEFEVEREHGALKYELTIRLRDAETGIHAVSVDGLRIGDISVDTQGFGRLELSSRPGKGEQPFLGGQVPSIRLGSTVDVGDFLSATIGLGFPSTDGTVSTTTTRLTLTGNSSLLAFVEYEVEPENGGLKKELKVDVRNAAAGATVDLFVNGADVGDIAIDDRGRGMLRYSTHPDLGEQAFPQGFPEIVVGTTINVEQLAFGAFDTLPSTVPGGAAPVESEFQGGLFGSTGARGGARYETQLEDGGFLEHQFRVHVRDAVPGSQHAIRVDGVFVGNLMVGFDGRGMVDLSNRMNDPRELPMPANFPDVHAGTRVDVGVSLTGFLVQQTSLVNAAGIHFGTLAIRNPLPFEGSSLGIAAI